MSLLTIESLTIDFDRGQKRSRALYGLDLTVGVDEALGIVGESGCGKTITWLGVLGLLDKHARINGTVRLGDLDLLRATAQQRSTVRGGQIAMIFQDPSSALNPLHRIGWQLGEILRNHRGLTGAKASAEMLRLMDRVGIANGRQRLREYPHELSGGMNQRVMIAMALAGQPQLLIADEPTTALDATIQAQILELIAEVRQELRMSLVLISHDLGVVAEVADRIAVMYAGRVVEEAPVETVFTAPAHPYTSGLVEALPSLEGPRRRLSAIPGTVPTPDRLPAGCSFSPRCAYATPRCTTQTPRLEAVLASPSHRAACHFPLTTAQVAK
jgi:peptide/nickel transport system ATP-binding protein